MSTIAWMNWETLQVLQASYYNMGVGLHLLHCDTSQQHGPSALLYTIFFPLFLAPLLWHQPALLYWLPHAVLLLSLLISGSAYLAGHRWIVCPLKALFRLACAEVHVLHTADSVHFMRKIKHGLKLSYLNFLENHVSRKETLAVANAVELHLSTHKHAHTPLPCM
jgi:hypothetical protein